MDIEDGPVVEKRSVKAGLPPGTLIHIGQRKVEEVRITVIDYDELRFREEEVKQVEDCFPFKDTPTVTWINIDGLHRTEVVEALGERFDIHHLMLEDILNTRQRPKFEDLGSSIFIVLKMLSFDDANGRIEVEQVSLVLGANFVMSFQERIGDVFEQIRDRIRNAKGRIRKMGADYLAYAILDAVVDHYYVIMERLGERIERIEEEMDDMPTEKMPGRIHFLKREIISLRKSVWPLREVIGGLQRSESPLVKESTDMYLRDVYDHTIQVIDTVETYRDMLSGLLDLYLSAVSNRMNAVMKVLTIIATIFIPLGFFAGVYGMNFEHMPELKWRWVYPYGFWGAITVIVAGMLAFFKRKKWL